SSMPPLAYAPLLALSGVRLRPAADLVEGVEERRLDAILVAVALELPFHPFVLPQPLSQHRVLTEADARTVAVLDRDQAIGRKRLLPHRGGLDGPGRLKERLALVVGAGLREQRRDDQ